jgi:ATP-dependent DNA ligase
LRSSRRKTASKSAARSLIAKPNRSAQWCPLKPKPVVEVCYDHFSGDRFRHGTSILRCRPDKAPRQRTFDQLKQKAVDPMKLLA